MRDDDAKAGAVTMFFCGIAGLAETGVEVLGCGAGAGAAGPTARAAAGER